MKGDMGEDIPWGRIYAGTTGILKKESLKGAYYGLWRSRSLWRFKAWSIGAERISAAPRDHAEWGESKSRLLLAPGKTSVAKAAAGGIGITFPLDSASGGAAHLQYVAAADLSRTCQAYDRRSRSADGSGTIL